MRHTFSSPLFLFQAEDGIRGSPLSRGLGDVYKGRVYERYRAGLKARWRDWLNLARLYDPAERLQPTAVTNGTNEWQMRNQMRAWVHFITASMPGGAYALQGSASSPTTLPSAAQEQAV